FRERGRQVPTAERRRRIDADAPGGCAVQGGGFGARQVQLMNDATGPLGERQPRGGWTYRMGAAADQLHAEGTLQRIDASRDRRRCQCVAPCGGGKTAGIQHVEKQSELLGKGVGLHGVYLLCQKRKAIVRGCALPFHRWRRSIAIFEKGCW